MTGTSAVSSHAWRSALVALAVCLGVGVVTGVAVGAGLARLVDTVFGHHVDQDVPRDRS